MVALGRLPFPTSLAFEPVQLCNARCFCCPYSWLKDAEGYLNERMPRENIERLLASFGDVRKTHRYQGTLVVNPFRYSDPLVCPDLDLILELCKRRDIGAVITTNAASLNEPRQQILDQHAAVVRKISVSIIGCSEEDVRERMGISLGRVLANLERMAKSSARLTSMTRISLRRLTLDDQEKARLEDLAERLHRMGFTAVNTQDTWLTNRVDVADFSKDGLPTRESGGGQSPDRFVNGCSWGNNLLERLEVMVNGDVVLCCDDAERHKVFGNVFEQGIADIWNGPLLQEHERIMSATYSAEKNELICGTCSRACWSTPGGPGSDELADAEMRRQREQKLRGEQVAWKLRRLHQQGQHDLQQQRDRVTELETAAAEAAAEAEKKTSRRWFGFQR